MLESPVNRNPAQTPWFDPSIFGTRGVPFAIEHVKILPGENIPIAAKKCAAQMCWQRFQCALIFQIVRVHRIVSHRGFYE